MEVILLENHDQLGRRGEIVTVKDGYARNFLIPSGLATFVTADNLRRAELLKKKYIQEEMERLGNLKELAAKLGTVSVTIRAKASEEGNLFGSVGPGQILDALKEQGFELEPKTVRLEENIRRVGVYSVPIHLHADIGTEIKLWVVEEREDDPEQPASPDEQSEES
jgi:large subunit ribosomal protein L9